MFFSMELIFDSLVNYRETEGSVLSVHTVPVPFRKDGQITSIQNTAVVSGVVASGAELHTWLEH